MNETFILDFRMTSNVIQRNRKDIILRNPVRAYLAERLLSSSFCRAASAKGLFLVLEVWISCNSSIPLEIKYVIEKICKEFESFKSSYTMIVHN